MKYLLLSRKTFIKTLCLFAGVWFLFTLNAQAQLSGVVFKDFNNDGIQTPPNELGLRNITVSVFVGSSTTPLVIQTGLDGSYGFTADEVPPGSKVRVEFTGLGANNNGKSAGQSKTNIQFLTIPSGGATDVSLGILTNNDYCTIDGALIYTPCYVNGNALGGGSAGADDALVSFSYSASGVGGTTGPMPTHIATASEVGSLWGIDYQGRGKTVVTSAVVRRHVGLGPLGTGGIYKFNTTSNAVEPLIDVKTIGIDTGPDPHTDLPADKLLSSQDAASVAAAGTVGIGSIALSSDEKTIYMVNLYDRKLYSFFVGTPAKTPSAASVKSYAIPNPCSDGDYRPWSVKEYQGKLYLGVVCTSETAQDSTALTGTIYQFDQKTGVFTLFYQFPLTYKRGAADATDECINIRYWKPWSNTFPKACASFFDAERGKTVGFAINPQPLIADLEFDTDGSMVIGLMDRFGLAVGFRALAPVDDGKLYDGFVSGDILRVYNNNGVFEMESNGQAGPFVGSGVGNDEGFGGGEFYGRDYWNFFGKPAHSEISNGGLMLLPGSGEILSSAMDPVDEVYHAGGFQIFSNTDGSLLRSFAVYAGKPGSLGKSGGVGDMKATCGNAFIELGNRVWHDVNKNGIQDPDEDGIDGLTVTLHDMEKDAVEVARTTTANGGTYVFNNENVTDTVKYEHHYQIRVKMLQDGLVNNELIEVSPGGTPIEPDGSEDPAEMRDSDAILVKISLPLNKAKLLGTNGLANDDYAVVDFMTGATTLSNHSLDIGIGGCTPPTDVTASSNSPINEGQSINLTSTSTGGIDYAWVGPNGFSSALQNPSITAATLEMSGIYTVTVTGNGTCTATATTNIIVNCVPPSGVLASSNSPINEEQTINLSATSTGGSGTPTYSWAGPNGFSSTLQNPSITAATLDMNGIYTVTITGNGTCTATAVTPVIVNCIAPTNVIAASNSPVNEGQTINLSVTSTGGSGTPTYSWAGPNGFSSTLQNPSITAATLDMNGIYTVTITGNGTCTATAITPVVVNCIAPTNVIVANNSPINEGQTINLSVTSTGGSGTPTYSWAGPNGFASTLQNPSIVSATLAMNGIYTLTVTGNGTCTATATTNVIFYASMGDYAWYDFNKNGIQDNIMSPFGVNMGKELPAKGIIMALYKADGTLIGKDTTDINGRYNFNRLLPGSYYVKFDPVSYPSVEYAVTGQNSGSNDSLDNDIEKVVYKSANFTLASGQNDPTWDIGLFRGSKSTIGDPCTCHDIVYDPDEVYEVLDEIIVESTPGGMWVIIEQTGVQKIDTFTNIPMPIGTLLIPDSNKPGRYSLRFAHDVGVGYTVKVTNGVDTLSQSNLCNIPALFTNVPTDTVCAFEKPIKLAGKMMFNNVDVTDGTIKFYKVKGFENYGTTGNPVYTQITEFNALDFAPGDTIDIIAEYTPNKTTQCPIKKWYHFILAIDPTCLAQIGDFVWQDTNKNGVQDVGEKGIPNVAVSLLDTLGNVVNKDAYGNSLLGKTTDINGLYEFINLPPAAYKVKFGKPTAYTTTTKDALSATDANDSDADMATGISQTVTLTQGQRNATIDAGFYLTCVPPTNVIAISNSPVNEGQQIQLNATSTGGTGYSWTGPNGFTSTLQNPTIASAAIYMAGTYTVTVKSSDNCTSTASTNVIINQVCKSICIPVKIKKIKI